MKALFTIIEHKLEQPIQGEHGLKGFIVPDLELCSVEGWFPEWVFDGHPHRAMEMVTYVIGGQIGHYDNQGNSRSVRPRQRATDNRRPTIYRLQIRFDLHNFRS